MLKYRLDVLFFSDLVTSVYFPLHRQPLSTSHATVHMLSQTRRLV